MRLLGAKGGAASSGSPKIAAADMWNAPLPQPVVSNWGRITTLMNRLAPSREKKAPAPP